MSKNEGGDSLGRFTHVDLLHPSHYLKAADLQGREVTVTIRDIEPRHELVCNKNGKVVREEKPVLWFEKAEKGLVLNKTNAKTIAGIHGGELRGWFGRQITLYPTQVRCGRDTVDAVRVRENK